MDADHDSPPLIDTREGVDRLVAEILDPDRDYPILATSTDSAGLLPPAEQMLRELAVTSSAPLRAVRTGTATHRLAERLGRFEVYGGESRIWYPGLHPSHDPFRHPILWTSRTSLAQLERLVSKLLQSRRWTFLDPGITIGARVVKLTASEVVVSHAGQRLNVPGHLLAAGTPRHAGDVVSLGQPVEGVVVVGQDRRPQLNLVACQPNPWQRAADQVQRGDCVVVRVLAVGALGARLELLPGVTAHVSRAQTPFGDDRRGLTVPAIVEAIDPQRQMLRLRLQDLPIGELTPVPVAVYPDGPPYLADHPLRGGAGRARDRLVARVSRTPAPPRSGLPTRRAVRAQRQLPLSEDGVRAAIDTRWFELYTQSDRDRYPLGRILFDADFVGSANRVVQDRDAFVRFCTFIASNRLDQVRPRVHQVRDGRGGSPIRRDGATLWRFYLEQNRASARRMHYWLLSEPGGGHAVEFVNVTIHDDDIPFVS